MYSYDNSHDANLYLRDTLVKYGDELVTVIDVNSDMMVLVQQPGGRNNLVAIEELNLTPIKLGYVLDTTNQRTIYLEREPRRQWRQGIYTGVCRMRQSDGLGRGARVSLSVDSRLTKRIARGRFPTVHKAYRVAVKTRSEIPFSPIFSVDFLSQVRYKTDIVGSWCKNRIDLLNSFFYLEDTVEEYMNAYYRNC